MGALFSSFSSGVDVSDVYVNFQGAEPNEKEQELWDTVNELLVEGVALLREVEAYEDCGMEIRAALSQPTPENERTAFNRVSNNVKTIAKIYQFSKKVDKIFPTLLRSLATDDEKSSIREQQAISRKVADILDFVLRFDELKMLRPGLQNDFAYYRRSLGKHQNDPNLVVRDDEAAFISLFIAQAIPMMSGLAKSTSELLNDGPFMAIHVPKVLATIANVCLHLVKTKRFPERETNILCVRGMVGCIVLFDHISVEGAFVKRSGINIRQAVQLVVKDYGDLKPLVNALKYSTVHFQDDSTPSAITDLLSSA